MTQQPEAPYCPSYITGLRINYYPQGYDRALEVAFTDAVKSYWDAKAAHSTHKPGDPANGVLVCWLGEHLSAMAALFDYRSTYEFWFEFLQDDEVLGLCKSWLRGGLDRISREDAEAFEAAKIDSSRYKVRIKFEHIMGYITGRLQPALTVEQMYEREEEILVEEGMSERQIKKLLRRSAVKRWLAEAHFFF